MARELPRVVDPHAGHNATQEATQGSEWSMLQVSDHSEDITKQPCNSWISIEYGIWEEQGWR